ncbi:hypothetical protein Cni_G09543 [Canna indica]|uniref:DUF668 domain-containing protein n=1 Tax=Canna indica TaxID=4628 RepID=A0AAQ3K4H9_9LILI|nr:hypothetical protein Cni_G09543 [Canna indica]
MRKVKEKGASVGVLAFEVAALMSKAVHHWHALEGVRLNWLRDEAFRLEGVRRLVSDDNDYLLALALAEMTDLLSVLARSVIRLSRRCSDPLLQRFDAAFADLVKNGADPFGFEYAGRKMEFKVKKMERFVAVSAKLYRELELLDERQQNLRRILANPDAYRCHGGVAGVKEKIVWQKQLVKCLREASLWVRTFDYVVRLLGRSLFSIVKRIHQVFGFQPKEKEATVRSTDHYRRSTAGLILCHPPIFRSPYSPDGYAAHVFDSVPLAVNSRAFAGQCLPVRKKWPTRGGVFGECAAGADELPELQQSCISFKISFQRLHTKPLLVHRAHPSNSEDDMVCRNFSLSMIEPRFLQTHAPAATLGAAALALHYANVVMTIEKLAVSPRLIDADERSGLYSILTTSIRAALRDRLRHKAKDSDPSSFCDPALAAQWSTEIARTLEWLAPLAHNMIKWQVERSFEQRRLSPSSSVLLLQTLHFANREKTEGAITDLLVGLDYLWRYGRGTSDKAVAECVCQHQKR